MLIKCSDCQAQLEAIERAGFLKDTKVYFVPRHQASWQLTSFKKIYRICNRSLMKVQSKEIINTDHAPTNTSPDSSE